MGLLSTIGAASGRAFGLTRVGAAIRDAYFNLTTLLLPGNGTNGAQNNTFLDSSSNNFTITRNGNTTQGTFSPFSQTGWSNFFDGTGDYLTLPVNSAFDLGTNACSIEAWVYPLNTSAIGIFCTTTGGAGQTRPNFYVTTTAFQADFFGNIFFSGSATIPLNSWNHVVFTRDATNGAWRFFLNGVLTGYNATGTQNLLQTTVAQTIGFYAGTSANAYISNVRIVNGSVPTSYQTSSTTTGTNIFTPATAPLTTTSQGATSGDVKLLTCQSNRFIDSSANAFAITVNGNPSVQAFSPFAPTAAYSAATVGGSGYFDGSADYLTASGNAAFAFGTGDFTVAAWVYPTSTSATTVLSSNYSYSTGAGNWSLYFGSGTPATLYFNSQSGNKASSVTTTIPLNAWTHVAYTRVGTTGRFFVNGVQLGANISDSFNYGGGTGNLFVGQQSNGDGPWYGYMADVQVLKGTGYSTLAIPTAPATNITNTSLLLNFTNAGITDATAKNDLETVGNAQISTTQSKFGGSSMYFDGTGDYLTSYNGGGLFRLGTVYTVEMWFYTTTVAAGNAGLINFATTVSGNAGFNLYRSSAEIICNDGATGGTGPSSGASSVSANTWTHLAVVSNGTTTKLYLDGVEKGSYTGTTGSANSMTYVTIGSFNDKGSPFSGYIDDLRITRGYARYTANFTPPTAAFALQ